CGAVVRDRHIAHGREIETGDAAECTAGRASIVSDRQAAPHSRPVSDYSVTTKCAAGNAAIVNDRGIAHGRAVTELCVAAKCAADRATIVNDRGIARRRAVRPHGYSGTCVVFCPDRAAIVGALGTPRSRTIEEK